MADAFKPEVELQKLKDLSFDDIQAGRMTVGVGSIDSHALFMDELRTLTGSQLRQMAAVSDKQVLALGAKVNLHEAPSQCIDVVIFTGSRQVKMGNHQSNGWTIGIALDEQNLMSAKCK